MKILLLLGLVILIVGCSPKVTRIDNLGAYQQQATVLEIPEQNTIQQLPAQNVVQNTSVPTTKETTTSKHVASSKSSLEEQQKITVNPNEEYSAIKCCDEGRFFIETKKIRTAYTEADIREILIASYRANCDSLKDYVTQRVYLRHTGDVQDSSYLTFFKGINYKKIQVDYKTVSSSFEGCT